MKFNVSKFRRNVVASLASLSLAASGASVANATFSSKMCTFNNTLGFFKDAILAVFLGKTAAEAMENSGDNYEEDCTPDDKWSSIGWISTFGAVDRGASAAGRLFSIPRDMNTTDALNDYNAREKAKKQFGGMPMQQNINMAYGAQPPNMNMAYGAQSQNMNMAYGAQPKNMNAYGGAAPMGINQKCLSQSLPQR